MNLLPVNVCIEQIRSLFRYCFNTHYIKLAIIPHFKKATQYIVLDC